MYYCSLYANVLYKNTRYYTIWECVKTYLNNNSIQHNSLRQSSSRLNSLSTTTKLICSILVSTSTVWISVPVLLEMPITFSLCWCRTQARSLPRPITHSENERMQVSQNEECMGCARGLGLGKQHVQDKGSLKWCYILSSGVARILVRGIQFNII